MIQIILKVTNLLSILKIMEKKFWIDCKDQFYERTKSNKWKSLLEQHTLSCVLDLQKDGQLSLHYIFKFYSLQTENKCWMNWITLYLNQERFVIMVNISVEEAIMKSNVWKMKLKEFRLILKHKSWIKDNELQKLDLHHLL